MPKWDPFKDFISIRERIDSLFDDVISKNRSCDGLSYGVWSPPVDIYETEREIIMKAELPGMTREDFRIEVNDNVITLFGERKFAKDLRDENYSRMERQYGTFKRVFNLPNSVEEKDVTANYELGVLEISIPKSAGEKPRRIKIEVE